MESWIKINQQIPLQAQGSSKINQQPQPLMLLQYTQLLTRRSKTIQSLLNAVLLTEVMAVLNSNSKQKVQVKHRPNNQQSNNKTLLLKHNQLPMLT